MASDKGPIATEAPPLTTTALHAAIAPAIASDTFGLDSHRAKSLKRTRETTPTSPGSGAATHLNPIGSPTKSARLAIATRRSPTPLTAAAGLEDERRRRDEQQQSWEESRSSENPARTVLELLSGGALAMSRPSDAPAAPTAAMEPSTKVPTAVSIPPNNAAHTDSRADTSPQSVTSAASIAGPPVTESPAPMDVDLKNEAPTQHVAAQEEKTTPGSLSYPGSLQAVGVMPAPPARGMSYPIPSQGQTSPTSSSGKKHKCPFCDTEFTRHHNLKSHLLTHSQEKPYLCQECQMRFRRLHDLKRHSKLHSGEKPHICPKCDRKFARGDALARHAKGAGGCAGRRSSMGSFADGDDMEGTSMTEGDDSMAGVVYDNDEDMTEEERRRLSLPSIKAQHVAGSQAGEAYSPHSRTYPPAGPRASTTGGLYPPNVDRGTSSTTTSPSMPNSITGGHTPNTSISSMPHSAATSSSMYSQSGMTESPKPLSPAGIQSNQLGHDSSGIARQRSPSLTQQFQQQHFGRRQSDRHTPPGLSLPSPHAGPKLPGLSGFAAPESRYAAGQTGTAGQQSGAHSRNSSGQQPGSGDSTSNLFASGDPGVWAYMQTLEERVKQLSDKIQVMEKADTAKQAQITYLTSEVTAMKKQLEARQGDGPVTNSA
jgi:hypothetical protein